MADEQQAQDKYAFILVDCGITSSQEELLSHAKFAREGETFPDDEPTLESAEKDDSRRKLDGGGGSERKRGVEIVGGGAENAGGGNLGFRGDRKSAREGKCGDGREIEPESKKTRVSPLVHCSCGERMRVIEVSGGLMVEIGSSSKAVGVPEGGGWTEKLDSAGVGDGVGGEGEGEGKEEGKGVKRKLELLMDTEVINIDDEEIEGENAEEGGGGKEGGEDCGEGSRKVEGNERGGDGEEDGLRRGKRELPPSMYGLVWGEGTGDMITNMNMNRNGDRELEGGLKGISEEEKKDKEEKKEGNEDVAFKCILDVLRVIVPKEERSNGNSNIDILETAKQCGMKFPRSRFLPKVEDGK